MSGNFPWAAAQAGPEEVPRHEGCKGQPERGFHASGW